MIIISHLCLIYHLICLIYHHLFSPLISFQTRSCILLSFASIKYPTINPRQVAMIPTPKNTNTHVNILAESLLGTKSPYPTVVRVITCFRDFQLLILQTQKNREIHSIREGPFHASWIKYNTEEDIGNYDDSWYHKYYFKCPIESKSQSRISLFLTISFENLDSQRQKLQQIPEQS